MENDVVSLISLINLILHLVKSINSSYIVQFDDETKLANTNNCGISITNR